MPGRTSHLFIAFFLLGILLGGSTLLGRDEDRHAFAFKNGRLLLLSVLLQIFRKACQDILTLFLEED